MSPKNDIRETIAVEIARGRDGTTNLVEGPADDNGVRTRGRERSADRPVKEIDPARLNAIGIIASGSDKDVIESVAIDISRRGDGEPKVIAEGLSGNRSDGV
jgi:hypothetical protein